jgi:hypothetical protein
MSPELALDAKSIVALAFRNGPIEDVHAGKDCPMGAAKPGYSPITQGEPYAFEYSNDFRVLNPGQASHPEICWMPTSKQLR